MYTVHLFRRQTYKQTDREKVVFELSEEDVMRKKIKVKKENKIRIIKLDPDWTRYNLQRVRI